MARSLRTTETRGAEGPAHVSGSAAAAVSTQDMGDEKGVTTGNGGAGGGGAGKGAYVLPRLQLGDAAPAVSNGCCPSFLFIF